MSIKTDPPTSQTNPKPDDSSPVRRPSFRLQFTAWLVILASFAIFCVVAYLLFNLVSDFFSRSVQNQPATIEIIKGQNVFLQTSGQGPEIKANNRQTANMGDVIQTDKDTSARLEIFDGTVLEIMPNSRVVIKESKIVTTNFVRKEKFVSFDVSTLASGENQPAVVLIKPAPPTANNFIGQAVKVNMPEGVQLIFDDSNKDGAFTINIERNPENTQRTVVTGMSASRAYAKLRAANVERIVTAGQRFAVEQGQPPIELAARVQQYIENGGFLEGLDKWQAQQKPASPNVRVIGSIIVDTEKVDDGSQNRVHITRVPSEKDPAITDNTENSLIQDLSKTSLFDYTSLEFSIKLRIKRQSLAGGGEAGYEYPLFVKINYLDQNGGKREYFHGFYFRPRSDTTKTLDSGPEFNSSERLKEDAWFEFKFDLAKLRDRPTRLSDITVGASGHEYEVFFTEISIIAKG